MPIPSMMPYPGEAEKSLETIDVKTSETPEVELGTLPILDYVTIGNIDRSSVKFPDVGLSLTSNAIRITLCGTAISVAHGDEKMLRELFTRNKAALEEALRGVHTAVASLDSTLKAIKKHRHEIAKNYADYSTIKDAHE